MSGLAVSNLGNTVALARDLYQQRFGTAYRGYVRRDPMALLELRPGRGDPYRIYERIRTPGGVTSSARGELLVTSRRWCDWVLRDRRFGVSPPDSGQPGGPGDVAFVGTDSPDHARLRALAFAPFSPKAVATYRTMVERKADEFIHRLPASGRFDLITRFALPFPVAVIADLLGIPDADVADVMRCGTIVGSAVAYGGVKSPRHAASVQASEDQLRQLFTRLFEIRRHEPTADVISRLVAAEGDQIHPREMLPTCMLLLVSGFVTTANVIGNGLLALLRHPAQWEELCAVPGKLSAGAVEETLRYDPPVHDVTRYAQESLDLDGVTIARGQPAVALIGAANRDPDVYDSPGAFDIRRPNATEHLAFSGGPHACMGQALARLEAVIAFEKLAAAIGSVRLAGPVRRTSGTGVRGPERLPVRR